MPGSFCRLGENWSCVGGSSVFSSVNQVGLSVDDVDGQTQTEMVQHVDGHGIPENLAVFCQVIHLHRVHMESNGSPGPKGACGVRRERPSSVRVSVVRFG